MKKKLKLIVPLAIIFVAVAFIITWGVTHNVRVFSPAGPVAHQERYLMFVALLLSAVVVVPTFALTIFIAVRYNENNKKPKKYRPDFDHSRLFEGIWWGVPIVIILILSVVTWNSAHSLDPYRQLASAKEPLNVEIVSLDWKWLFIYPDLHVASVNQMAIPVNTPVSLDVTSDTIMNSFWIPSLGGQIYSMPGMITHLHTMASRSGSFLGSPANIAGKGFARMDFTVKSMSQAHFDSWVNRAANSDSNLTMIAYQKLARPSDNVPVTYYSPVQDGLFQAIVGKYLPASMPGMMNDSMNSGSPMMSNVQSQPMNQPMDNAGSTSSGMSAVGSGAEPTPKQMQMQMEKQSSEPTKCGDMPAGYKGVYSPC